jgi:hypothetical protein
MTDQLSIYNGALRILGERKLASLSESRESRRHLDDEWGDGSTTGVVKSCLEMAEWTFAKRTVQITYSPSVSPLFGYSRAFEQPSDLVRVCGVFQDEFCQVPLTQYTDERRYWYGYLDTIYVSYVSNLAAYGADMSLWSEAFVDLVQSELAAKIVWSLKQDKVARREVFQLREINRKFAKNLDTSNKPTAFAPPGSWSTSRRGNAGSRDRTPTGSLIG